MATYVVGTGDYIRPYRQSHMRQFLVDTSQTVLLGSLLVLSADSDEGNRVKVAGADPTVDNSLVGIAAEAITTTGTHDSKTDKVNVWIFDADTEFIARCEASAAIDNDDIGVEYGVVVDGTNLITRVDRTETSAKVFRVVALAPGFVHGDVNGAFIVKPIKSERLYGA